MIATTSELIANQIPETICILFCFDKNYAGQAGVALSSLLDHNKHSSFEIYIAGFTPPLDDSENIIDDIAARHPSCKIIYKNIDGSVFASFPVTRYISRSAYIRTLLGQIVDPRHTRLLYLDADIIICSDIRDLWATSLDGYIAAAVQDHFVLDREAIGFRSDEPYFNSGVLLINMPAWRAARCEEQIIAYLAEHGPKLQFIDQDALNAILRGKVNFVDVAWNFQPRCADVPARFLGLNSQSYARLRANPKLIHYTTSIKPWNAPHRVHYSDRFFEAVRVAGLEKFFNRVAPGDLSGKTIAVKTWLRWRFPSLFRALRRLIKPKSAARMYRERATSKEKTT